MKRLSMTLSLACLLACRHDADELGPMRSDVTTWLGLQNQPACAECIETRCDVADLCLADGECKLIAKQCMPPNPGCAQATLLTRHMTACILYDCKAECSRGGAQECIGKYGWLASLQPGAEAFQLRLQQFLNPYPGVASVVPCVGLATACDESSLVMLEQDVTVSASYTQTVSMARPWFRVRGEGLREMYFYEDAHVSSGYHLNIPALVEADFQLLVGFLGTQEDRTKGTLDVVIFDCNGGRLAGVQLQLKRAGVTLSGDALGTAYYFDERFPKPAAVQPVTHVMTGQAGFVNLEPGLYDITATLDGRVVSLIESVAIDARVVTHVNLMPLSLDEVARVSP